jgi:ASC-1-like (ASCH) protein
MRLQTSPFEKIKTGQKTIEIRLNDEKRQRVKVGDEIIFILLTDTNSKIKVEVIELLVFPSFKILFSAFPPHEYGSKSKDEFREMYKYYSKAYEEKYGVLGIRIKYLGDVTM